MRRFLLILVVLGLIAAALGLYLTRPRADGSDVLQGLTGDVAAGDLGGRRLQHVDNRAARRLTAATVGCHGNLQPFAAIIGIVRIPLKRLDPDLPIPAHAHEGDGGVDLYAAAPVTLEPGARAVVPTGIAVAIPSGFAGLVTPRSGLAARHGLGIVNAPGLVDSGYRGEIKVIVVNHGSETVDIQRSDRIAQLVVVPVVVQDLAEVDELPESSRGEGGLGSTGT